MLTPRPNPSSIHHFPTQHYFLLYLGWCMMRKAPVPGLSCSHSTCFPLHHVITEAEAFAALRDEVQAFRAENQAFRDENQLLRERLAAVEDQRTGMQNPTPSPAPTLLALAPPLFKEPKITEPPTFNGKASEYLSFLQQCKLYIRMKPITF